jgi:hypothetical protein
MPARAEIRPPLGQRYGCDLVSLTLDTCKLVTDEFDALFLERPAEERQQCMGVKPAFAGSTIGTGRYAVTREPGEPPHQGIRVFQNNVGAFVDLHRVICAQDRHAVLPGKDQVALFTKTDIGIRAEALFQIPKEVEREARQADVFRDGKLLADRSRGERRCRVGELRVTFDDGD